MNTVTDVRLKWGALLLQYGLILGMLLSFLPFWNDGFSYFATFFLFFGWFQVANSVYTRLRYGPELSVGRDTYDTIVGLLGMYYTVGMIADQLSDEHFYNRMDTDWMGYIYWVYVITLALPLVIKMVQDKSSTPGIWILIALIAILHITVAISSNSGLGIILFVPLWGMLLLGPALAGFYLALQHVEIANNNRTKNHSPLDV